MEAGKQPPIQSLEEARDWERVFIGEIKAGRDRRRRQSPCGSPPDVAPMDVASFHLAMVPWTDGFRRFIIGHTAFLAAVPRWTLRIVFPQFLQRAIPEYETVVAEELRTRLDGQTLQLVYRYFLHWQLDDFNTALEPLRTDLRGYAERFTGPWFSYRYKWWRTERAAALVPIPAAIPEALASGRGVVEPVVLPHTYEHLLPLVTQRRDRDRHAQRRKRTRTRLAHTINPVQDVNDPAARLRRRLPINIRR